MKTESVIITILSFLICIETIIAHEFVTMHSRDNTVGAKYCPQLLNCIKCSSDKTVCCPSVFPWTPVKCCADKENANCAGAISFGNIKKIEDTSRKTNADSNVVERDVGCSTGAKCVKCWSDQTVCCPTGLHPSFCCTKMMINDRCTVSPGMDFTSSIKFADVEIEAPVKQRALSKLHKLQPGAHSLVTLTVKKYGVRSGVAIVRLSGVEHGEHFAIEIGDHGACGGNVQTSRPVSMALMQGGKDNLVQLTVPSLECLRNQPVTVILVNTDGTTMPYACGRFIVL